MNYAIEQRLRLIDFLVDSYGHIGREHLIRYFGISEPQATRDFRLYKKRAPQNLAFNASTKKYVKAESFRPLFN